MSRYEQQADFNYDELPIFTKYRFAEIEINQFIKINMQKIYQFEPDRSQKVFQQLYSLLFLYSERYSEIESSLREALVSHQFQHPQRHELIPYFLYHGQSYKTIRELMGASPNTIAKYRFQQLPLFYPLFDHWTEPTLARWEAIKDGYNLWFQPLAHTQKEKSVF
jgi:hypothetical protein